MELVQRSVIRIDAIDLIGILRHPRAIHRNIGRVPSNRAVIRKRSSYSRRENEQLKNIARRKRKRIHAT